MYALLYIITSDNNNNAHVPDMHDIFLTHLYLMTWAKGERAAVGTCIMFVLF